MDLFEWTKPLDAMDAAIRKISLEHPALFLIPPTPCSHEFNKFSIL